MNLANRSEEKQVSLRLVENRANPLRADQVPTLVPNEIMAQLSAGDTEQYFRVQSIEYPVDGASPLWSSKRAVYLESFFSSFITIMNKRPIPGSKRGHEFKSRPNSDFYTVGGKLVASGAGKGTAHFKIYIPPEGDETPNRGFIRDNKAGIVQFSIEAAVEYSVDEKAQEVKILSVSGGARNDAVPEGAMEQIVNADEMLEQLDQVLNAEGDRLLAASVRKARSLINAGKYDATKRWAYTAAIKKRMLGPGSSDWANYKSWHFVEHTSAEEKTQARFGYPYGNGTVVLRSALQAIASRASGQELANVSRAASRLIDLIREKQESKSSRRSLMDTKEEALEFLTVNNAIPIADIAKAMGQSDRLLTAEHEKALTVVNGLAELKLGMDPVAAIKTLQEKVQQGESDRVANRLTAEFGPEKNAAGKMNPLRAYAVKVITNAEGLDEAIAEIKKDPVMQQLAGQRADFTVNEIGTHDTSGQPKKNEAVVAIETKDF